MSKSVVSLLGVWVMLAILLTGCSDESSPAPLGETAPTLSPAAISAPNAAATPTTATVESVTAVAVQTDSATTETDGNRRNGSGDNAQHRTEPTKAAQTPKRTEGTDLPELPQRGDSVRLIHEARQAYVDGRFAQALNLLDQIPTEHDSTTARTLSAMALREQGNCAGAIEQAKVAISNQDSSEPHQYHGQAHLALTDCYRSSGQQELAMQHINQAIAVTGTLGRDPFGPIATAFFGMLAYRDALHHHSDPEFYDEATFGKYLEASLLQASEDRNDLRSSQSALELAEDEYGKPSSLLLQRIAATLIKFDDPHRAIDLLERSLEHKDDAMTRAILAEAYLGGRRCSRGVVEAETALAMTPATYLTLNSEMYANIQLARCYALAGHYEQARPLVDTAIALLEEPGNLELDQRATLMNFQRELRSSAPPFTYNYAGERYEAHREHAIAIRESMRKEAPGVRAKDALDDFIDGDFSDAMFDISALPFSAWTFDSDLRSWELKYWEGLSAYHAYSEGETTLISSRGIGDALQIAGETLSESLQERITGIAGAVIVAIFQRVGQCEKAGQAAEQILAREPFAVDGYHSVVEIKRSLAACRYAEGDTAEALSELLAVIDLAEENGYSKWQIEVMNLDKAKLERELGTAGSTLAPTLTRPAQADSDTTSRASFESSAPSGYTGVTLRHSGIAWGVPQRYTDDSNHGVVAYMLLGTLKGCTFADAEADRRATVYVKIEQLGALSGYESGTVCRASSSSWNSWNGLRITHLRFFDESSPGNVVEHIYHPASGQYVEASGNSGNP